MCRHLWLAGLVACTSISAANAAQDIEVVANSILRAYSDYCDPLFFEQNRAADAPVDPTLAQSYARVLVTRHLGQCDRFFNAEVVPAAIVPRLLARLPELQPWQPRTLTAQQLTLLGSILRYDDITQNECRGQPQDTSDISSARAAAEPWWSAVGRDDVLELAKGYVEAEAYAQATVGFPSGGGTVTTCSAREVVGMMITLAVTGPIMPQPSGGGMSTQEFDQLMSQPSPIEGEGYGEDGPDAAADAPVAGDVLEPDDPCSRPDNDDKTIDPSQDVSATDAESVARFAGRWGTTELCDVPGGQYMIGQFNPGEWEKLGVGVPRIAASDLSCELGQFATFGSAVTFGAQCSGDGGDWRGTGSIQPGSGDTIQLFLFDDPSPVSLSRCHAPRH